LNAFFEQSTMCESVTLNQQQSTAPLRSHQMNDQRRRGLPVPGIIPETEAAKEAKEAKIARSAIAKACRGYIFRNNSTYAADGALAFRDKDIPEGKNPHGCGRILPA
jgi:hypothetical protein